MLKVKSKKVKTVDPVRTKDRIKKTGEVFTPPELVNEMLDRFPKETWTDKTQTFLDPSCGTGNFLIEVKNRLMIGLVEAIPDERERERHILTNMIYGVDIMPDNCEECRERLGLPRDDSTGNIVCADFLRYKPTFMKTVCGERVLGYDPNLTNKEEDILRKNLDITMRKYKKFKVLTSTINRVSLIVDKIVVENKNERYYITRCGGLDYIAMPFDHPYSY